jgi:tryptophan-rich sensory protein
MTTYEWYKNLIKPSWAPSSWILGLMWSVVLVGIATYIFSKMEVK